MADAGVDARTTSRAVAVTGQYASTVPVDANGEPTGPCLTWLDTRGGSYTRSAVGGPVQGYNPRKVLPFVRKSGGAPSTVWRRSDRPDSLPDERDEPDDRRRPRGGIMEPVDYLTMRFTGVASGDPRVAPGHVDDRQSRLSATIDYDAQLLALVGLDDDVLPPLQAVRQPSSARVAP